jgi:hypothetical protein
MKATLYGATRSRYVRVFQLPTYPISPPTGGESIGRISWDLPNMIKYTPGTQVTAHVEMVNPSLEQRLYVVQYYFVDKDGTIAEEDFVHFLAGDNEFIAFYLPPQQTQPAFFDISFSCNELDYTFGLRLLLCEMNDSTASVIQECSRVQVLLASESTYNKYQVPSWITIALGVSVLAVSLGIIMKEVR